MNGEFIVNQASVALIYCDQYQIENVRLAVQQGIALLGGAGQFVKPGEKILVKPNVLVGNDPEKCIGPHPNVFRAVLEQFQAAGAVLSCGDSPGFGTPRGGLRAAKLLPIAEELGVDLADFTNAETFSFHEGNLIKQFTIAKGVAESDGIISLGKLKSHQLTRITAAVKNTFGCIPGVRKAEFHARLPNADLFAQMLVDLNLFLKPCLYIVDGIMAMEGNGPRNGTPRAMNVLLFSTDPVALDATICRMINLDERLVETITYGNRFGLGSSDNIFYLGEAVARFHTPDFLVNRSKASTAGDMKILGSRLLRDAISPKPVIDAEKCNECGQCVQVCPAEPKALVWKNGKTEPPVYQYENCIRCYCCQELCSHEAVSVKVPWLGRLVHR